MLVKSIKFTDFNGFERTEDFLFNLTKSEVLEMELSVDGGLTQTLEKIVKTYDIKNLIGYFKKIVLASYGEKSPDGKRFVKSEEISTAFSQTAAYDVLFMELFSDTDKATEFVNGLAAGVTGTETPAATSLEVVQ